MNCQCQKSFAVRLARAEDYGTFKKILDAGKHPAFIGRGSFERNSQNGGALLYCVQGKAVAVSMINPHYGILLALNVHPDHRSHGLGAAIVSFLMPNFARVVEKRVEWFEKQGYVKIGKLKKGVSLNTQIMARAQLFKLAGRLRSMLEHAKKVCSDPEKIPTPHNGGVKLSNESPASNPDSEVVRPDCKRRKARRVSRKKGILAQAPGGAAI